MVFQNYTEPIEQLIERYFQKKRTLSREDSENREGVFLKESGRMDEQLPEVPLKLFRDEKNRVYKCVYGDYKALELNEETNIIIWQEEIVRNQQGVTIATVTTYPDGQAVRENMVREGDMVTEIQIGENSWA